MGNRRTGTERGTVLVVSLVVMTALVGLSSAFIARTLYERGLDNVQEDSLEALYNAYGKVARAEALVNRAEYDDHTGRNVVLQAALESETKEIADTGVRVEQVGDSEASFYQLVASDTVGRVTRQVRMLLRGRQSFADYNYFVNAHPLGIAGNPTPRGSIHTNRRLDLYYPDGRFVEPVTASGGFRYLAGATEENTTFLGPVNDAADEITDLLTVDVRSLEESASYSVSGDYDVRVSLEDGNARIAKYTPRGWRERVNAAVEGIDPVYRTETRTREVPVYETEEYTETVTEYVREPRTETRTRQVPVYRTETETRTRWEEVWVPDDGAGEGGGTDLAGGGELGYWQWVEVPYEVEVQVVDHYETETYQVTVWVVVDEIQRTVTGTREVLVGWETEEYEEQVFDHYERHVMDVRETYWSFDEGTQVSEEIVPADGVFYFGGDVLALEGNLNGRMTVASERDVLVTGNLVYRDDDQDRAYLNGDSSEGEYEPNPEYDGRSVLGVIAERNVLYTEDVSDHFEVNASMLAKTGRVGVTGVRIDDDGDVFLEGGSFCSTRPRERRIHEFESVEAAGEALRLGAHWLLEHGYTEEEAASIMEVTRDYYEEQLGASLEMPPIEPADLGFERPSEPPEAYEHYVKESIRRLGGIITHLRPVSALIGDRQVVQAGFRGGKSVYDTRLLARPPAAFPDRARPRRLSVIATEVVQ